MTDPQDFRRWAHEAADWSADYLDTVAERPVRAQVAPGEVFRQLPSAPPHRGEAMEAIFADLDRIVMPGMTHWQPPRFFAYSPANSSPPSVVAEFVTAALAAQCMLWQTSPAATELETRVLDWLRQMIGLGQGFSGVIRAEHNGTRKGRGWAERREPAPNGWRRDPNAVWKAKALQVTTSRRVKRKHVRQTVDVSRGRAHMPSTQMAR